MFYSMLSDEVKNDREIVMQAVLRRNGYALKIRIC